MQRVIVQIILIVALSSAVIGTIFDGAVSGEMTPQVETPTPIPAPTVLFEDDFTSYSRRWDESESPKASVVYTDKAFSITIVSPGVNLWSAPDFSTPLRDYHVEVTAHVLNGSKDAQFGVVLENEDDALFYAFVIALDGTWRFLQYDDGIWRDLTPSGAVLLPVDAELAIRFQVDVTGANTFAFGVNDQQPQMVSVEGELAGAMFGLIARAEHGFIEVVFDDMLVTTVIRNDQE